MIKSAAKNNRSICLSALLIWMLSLSACENSLNDISKAASREAEKPMSRSTGVDVIYSDSAKVKAHMFAPVMDQVDAAANPSQEMPKGVKIIIYDDGLVEKGTITSEYAIRREKTNIIEFRKHVIAKNSQGETFKSEELIYDQGAKKFYSNKPVEITMVNGNVINGADFKSNDNLYPWTINNSVGVFHVNNKPLQ